MKDENRPEAKGVKNGLERKGPQVNKPTSKKPEPLNPFQSKLMELKKKFND
jgi:protein Tex